MLLVAVNTTLPLKQKKGLKSDQVRNGSICADLGLFFSQRRADLIVGCVKGFQESGKVLKSQEGVFLGMKSCTSVIRSL